MNLPAYRNPHEHFLALAPELGFDLAGVAPAADVGEFSAYAEWVRHGMAGEMSYLTDHRAGLRSDPRLLLSSARSVLCLGKIYRTASRPVPHGHGRVSCYAWGDDYHDWMRDHLETLTQRLREAWGPFESKVCVDTSPLLERSVAQAAGLGWIGRNTCLINQDLGSWFFLGEVLTSLDFPSAHPPPERCGSCTHCIDACPTQALIPAPFSGGPEYILDSRRCISYLTIELRGSIPAEHRSAMGDHLFGCDICQDVCPWNSRSPLTEEPAFQPRHPAVHLASAALLSAEEFRTRYRSSPIWRAKHQGFLRNVTIALGNSRNPSYLPLLRTLAGSPDPTVRSHASWAISQLPAS